MGRPSLLALTITAFALGGCAGPSTRDDPSGVAVEADGAAPLIDYPFDLGPMRPVPATAAGAVVARRDEGFLAVWIETKKGSSAVKALPLDGHGAPRASSPILVGTSDGTAASLAGAACAPGGDCAVVWGGEGTLRVSTLDADGSLRNHELAASVDPAAIAYDADAGQFVVALGSNAIYVVHLAKGKVVDHTQFDVASDGSSLDGIACAPGHGCLVTLTSVFDANATEGVIVDATGAGTRFSIASQRLRFLTYGDGVYFAAVGAGHGYGVLRLDLDGVPIDAAPIPVVDLGEGTRTIDGAAFDGESFTVIATARTVDAHGAAQVRTEGGRLLADGSAATPATFELGAFGAPLAFAGGDAGASAAIVGHDAAGEAALAALAIDHGLAAPDAAVLAKIDPGQRLDVTSSVGGRVLAVWSEESAARGRWFTSEGAAGPILELGPASTVDASPSAGDAGLLVVLHPDGSRATRVVTADGIGEEVPIELPATTRAAAAPFAWVAGKGDGSASLLRFDERGHALDAKPIDVIHRPPFADQPVPLLARAGDLFVVAERASSEPAASSIVRVRATGEIVGRTRFTASALGGLACSPKECVVTLRAEQTPDVASRRVLVGRMSMEGDEPPLTETPLGEGEPGPVVFDGQRFLVAYAVTRSLFVARLDGDVPEVGVRQRDGDDPVFFDAIARGRALLFSQVKTNTGSPPRPELLAHVSLVLVDGFGSATSAGATSGGGAEIVAEGGACAIAPPNGASGEAATLVAALALALRRRRRSALGVVQPGRLA